MGERLFAFGALQTARKQIDQGTQEVDLIVAEAQCLARTQGQHADHAPTITQRHQNAAHEPLTQQPMWHVESPLLLVIRDDDRLSCRECIAGRRIRPVGHQGAFGLFVHEADTGDHAQRELVRFELPENRRIGPDGARRCRRHAAQQRVGITRIDSEKAHVGNAFAVACAPQRLPDVLVLTEGTYRDQEQRGVGVLKGAERNFHHPLAAVLVPGRQFQRHSRGSFVPAGGNQVVQVHGLELARSVAEEFARRWIGKNDSPSRVNQQQRIGRG